jgi:hypothetical protein
MIMCAAKREQKQVVEQAKKHIFHFIAPYSPIHQSIIHLGIAMCNSQPINQP